MSALNYIEALEGVLARIRTTAYPSILEAGKAVGDALAAGGILHVFGSGHSHMLAEEAFYRAGGLAPVNPILDGRLVFFEGAQESSRAERETGYAATVIAREDVRAGDIAIVISNSGRNSVPIEMALEMKARGARTIALTNVEQSRSAVSRHPSGKRLFEVCDMVVDTCTPPGDAAVLLPGMKHPMGPASTVAGAAIINSIMIQAAMRLIELGAEVPVLPSANVVEPSESGLDQVLERYSTRIRYYKE